MAKNRVNVDVKVSDKGSLKQVGDKSRQSDRALKGLAKTSSSGTKNFSKMSQGITGGLVPAYATLAANLFAITALFSALKEAADLRVMREGMEAYAATTGQAMMTIALSLQTVTHAQLDYGEAMKATATLTAAGFDKTMILEMGTAARQASAAIGHGFEDAFNRITKGIQKAEPELLDELGIILRLDQATRNYAIATGKAQDELTLYERTVAVHNEVISQATEKYGALDKEIRVSGITQLGTAFENVKKSALEGIAPIAELFAGAFQRNIKLVIAAMILFAITMLKAAGMGDKLTAGADKWTARANAGATKATAAQAKFTEELRRSKMTMDEIKGQAMGKLRTIVPRGTGKGAEMLRKGQFSELAKNKKILRSWKNTARKHLKITQNMTDAEYADFMVMVNDLLMEEDKFVNKSKQKLEQFRINAEVQFTRAAGAGAKSFAMMTTVVKGLGRAFGMIFSFAMKLTMLKMFWEMGKQFAANFDKTYLSFTKLLQKMPKFKEFGEELEKQSEGWRKTKERIRKINEQYDKLNEIGKTLVSQTEEVQNISDAWKKSNDMIEEYIKMSNLLSSIDFSETIKQAVAAMNVIKRTTGDELLETEVTFAMTGGTGEDNLARAKKMAKAYIPMMDRTGPGAGLAYETELQKLGFTGDEVQAAYKALVRYTAAQDQHARATAYAVTKSKEYITEIQNTIDIISNIPSEAQGIVRETALKRMDEMAKKTLDLTPEIVKLFRDSEDLMTVYEKLRADPKISDEDALHWVGVYANILKEEGGSLGNELKSLDELVEKFLKVQNSLLQGTLPTGWGKQAQSFGDLDKIWARISGDERSGDIGLNQKTKDMLEEIGVDVSKMVVGDEEGTGGTLLETIFASDGAFEKAWKQVQKLAYGFQTEAAKVKADIVQLQNAGMKFQGAVGKRAQFINKQETLRLQITRGQTNEVDKLNAQYEELHSDLTAHQIAELPTYKIKLQAINDQTAALQKQKDVMEEQETLQFKLVDIMQKSWVNMFEQAILGEEKFFDTFKKIARAMFAQMAQLMAQQAAMNALMGLFPNSPNLQKAFGGVPAGGPRQGGILTQRGSSSYKSFAGGGVASGSQAGYLARLHGTEAVVPLGNDRSIPVKMEGNTQSNNVVVNISGVGQGQQGGQTATGDGLQQIGALIGNTVQGVLVDELRPGGLLYSGRGR